MKIFKAIGKCAVLIYLKLLFIIESLPFVNTFSNRFFKIDRQKASAETSQVKKIRRYYYE